MNITELRRALTDAAREVPAARASAVTAVRRRARRQRLYRRSLSAVAVAAGIVVAVIWVSSRPASRTQVNLGPGPVASAPTSSGQSSDSEATTTVLLAPSTSKANSASVGPPDTTCPPVAFRPQSSDLADQIQVHGTDCPTATSVILAGPDRPDYARLGHDYDADGFHCAAGPDTQPPGGGMSWWPYHCTGGTEITITFNRY